jgi:hypothetical protein
MLAPEGHVQTGNVDRFVWLSHGWMFNHSARLLASDMVIEWARAQALVTPSRANARTLDDAVITHVDLCARLSGDVEYYLDLFTSMRSKIRATHGTGLLWPLYVLSMSSTNSPEALGWIQEQASRVASVFSLRQGKVISDFMRLYLERYASQYSQKHDPLIPVGTRILSV